MEKDNYKTKVIFRVDERDNGFEVIAVFPEIPGDMNPYRTCLYYAHVGQHGAVDVGIASWTRPATAEEYKDLQKELESIGYDLRVCKRFSQKDLQERIAGTY